MHSSIDARPFAFDLSYSYVVDVEDLIRVRRFDPLDCDSRPFLFLTSFMLQPFENSGPLLLVLKFSFSINCRC